MAAESVFGFQIQISLNLHWHQKIRFIWNWPRYMWRGFIHMYFRPKQSHCPPSHQEYLSLSRCASANPTEKHSGLRCLVSREARIRCVYLLCGLRSTCYLPLYRPIWLSCRKCSLGSPRVRSWTFEWCVGNHAFGSPSYVTYINSEN